MAVLTALFSAFLNNATVVIFLLPVIFLSKTIKVHPEPFLISEIIALNIGGTATLIGDPPNIIIGSSAGLSFLDFIKELTPIIIIIFIVSVTFIDFHV